MTGLSSSSSTMGSPSTPKESQYTTLGGDTEDVFMSGHTQARGTSDKVLFSYMPLSSCIVKITAEDCNITKIELTFLLCLR